MDSLKASLVLRNAGVITLEPRRPRDRTIYIQGGRILKVSGRDIDPTATGPGARVIDCAGKTVIPAFHDAHCHISAYAESLINIDAGPASVHSIEDIISTIKETAAALPAGSWIRCAGYNEFYLEEKRHPTRHDLDRATAAHPVKLTHRSGHAHVLNSLALQLAGIDIESEEPPGGMIERDLGTGEPSGLLYGMAGYLSQRIAPASDEEMDTAITRAGRTLLSLGITMLQDASPGNDMARWNRFIDWKRRGRFEPRVVMMFGAGELDSLQGKQPFYDKATGLGSGAVKIIIDDVRGSLNPRQEELNRLAAGIHRRRLQAALHAVEETTVGAAVTALEYALKERPCKGHRHRLEHCSVCTPAMGRRLARMGAGVVTNPAFIYYSGERYLSEVPPHQLKHLYAIHTMLKAGVRVAAGSDAPVANPDPLKGIYAAVTRRAGTGQAVIPGEAISALDALKLYTINAAYSCFREKQTGSIAKGKWADLVVLNGDPLQVSPQELKNLKVEMTVLDGEVVYSEAI
ncbi:MAG: amidohydrolase [Chloroflexi bacterium]|nr:amidohydrolase [Chloroflexota bacterium]